MVLREEERRRKREEGAILVVCVLHSFLPSMSLRRGQYKKRKKGGNQREISLFNIPGGIGRALYAVLRSVLPIRFVLYLVAFALCASVVLLLPSRFYAPAGAPPAHAHGDLHYCAPLTLPPCNIAAWCLKTRYYCPRHPFSLPAHPCCLPPHTATTHAHLAYMHT